MGQFPLVHDSLLTLFAHIIVVWGKGMIPVKSYATGMEWWLNGAIVDVLIVQRNENMLAL
jgi:hypothetical protein